MTADAPAIVGEDVVSELAAAGEGIGRHCDISAEEACVGDD